MKFSNTLEFNAVQEWSDFYIHYDSLKHVIYDIEKLRAVRFRKAADEEEPLVADQVASEKCKEFLHLLNVELARVNTFYAKKSAELADQVGKLEQICRPFLPRSVTPQSDFSAQESRLGDGDDGHLLLGASTDFVLRMEIGQKVRDLYINLCSLKDYVVLNYTAFSKILKKYDKVLCEDLKAQYMPIVEQAPFWKLNSDSEHRAALNDQIGEVMHCYAHVCCGGDVERAASELGQHLREFVVWERNTVWRDMVGKERRVTAAGVKRVAEPPAPHWRIRLPYGKSVSFETKHITLVCCILVFIVALCIPMFDDMHQNRCFALLIFASMMWATESIPLFATSMLIPFLIVVLGILRTQNGDTMQKMVASDAAKFIFAQMFSPVIMLLLGGFSIAAALSKHHIAKGMATMMLSKAGTNSNYVLLTVLFIATFSSMWISNVAAPVLCISVIQPILRTLEPGNRFAQSLVMGIALASNIGGLVTPISSPQNAIAMENMDPPVTWPLWLTVTIPLAILSDLCCWLALIQVYRPSKTTPRVPPIRAHGEPMNSKQYFIIAVTLGTIGLWCCESLLRPWVGNSGVIAIVPMLLFFGTGILDKDDFNNFLWTVIMLAMGGIALGTAVSNSQLLKTIASSISQILQSQPLFVALCAFCLFTLFAATFISHTVSALIILPIVQEVGKTLPGDHANLLVMGAAMLCSGAMGLSISGFPNIFAVSIEDPTGRPYVTNKDFLKIGVPLSFVVFLLTISIGYGLMLLVGL